MVASWSYRNSFWTPTSIDPQTYIVYARPVEYRGYQIFHRIKGSRPSRNCFDLVKDGVCVRQMCGLEGCKRAADRFIEEAAKVPA